MAALYTRAEWEAQEQADATYNAECAKEGRPRMVWSIRDMLLTEEGQREFAPAFDNLLTADRVLYIVEQINKTHFRILGVRARQPPLRGVPAVLRPETSAQWLPLLDIDSVRGPHPIEPHFPEDGETPPPRSDGRVSPTQAATSG